MLGNFKEGEVFCEKGISNSAKIDDLIGLGFGESLYGQLLLVKGDGKFAVEHLQNGIKYFEQAKWPLLLGFAWSLSGYGFYLLGDLETAGKHMEKGLSIHTGLGAVIFLSLHYWGLSMVHCDSGDLEKAQSCAEKAVELSENNNEKMNEGIARIWMGRILGKADPSNRNKAQETIEQGIRILEELKVRPMVSVGCFFLGEFYAGTGQKDKARETLETALSMMDEMGMMYWPDRAREVLARL